MTERSSPSRIKRWVPFLSWPYGNGYDVGGWDPEQSNSYLKRKQLFDQLTFVVALGLTLAMQHAIGIPTGFRLIATAVAWVIMTVFYGDIPYVHMPLGLGVIWGVAALFTADWVHNEPASVLGAFLIPEILWVIGFFQRILEPKHEA